MMYAYIGEARREYAEVIIKRNKRVVVSGIWNNKAELAVRINDGENADRIADAYIRRLEMNRL